MNKKIKVLSKGKEKEFDSVAALCKWAYEDGFDNYYSLDKESMRIIDDYTCEVHDKCQFKNLDELLDAIYNGLEHYFEDGDCSSCPFGFEDKDGGGIYCKAGLSENGLEDYCCIANEKDLFKEKVKEYIDLKK